MDLLIYFSYIFESLRCSHDFYACREWLLRHHKRAVLILVVKFEVSNPLLLTRKT